MSKFVKILLTIVILLVVSFITTCLRGGGGNAGLCGILTGLACFAIYAVWRKKKED